MCRNQILSLLAMAALAACGSSSASSSTGDADTVDTTAEASAISGTGGSASSGAQAKGVASLFVQEDPTLDVSQSAAQNAQNVENQVRSAVQSACPGASISLSGTEVTVDFGADCNLKVGTISGEVTANVTEPSAGTVDVAFQFINLAVNSRSLSGSFEITTTTGTSFSVNADLTSGGQTLVLSAATFALDSDGAGVTMSGSGTVTSATGSQQVTLSNVHHTFQSCYADSGSISEVKTTTTRAGRKLTVTETLTFSSSTPTTGQAELQISGMQPTTVTLPSYGRCGGADGGA